MTRSSQNHPNHDPQITSQADVEIDAALKALNSVQPAARFEQRVHARLAQAQEAAAAGSSWSKTAEKFAGMFTWPRAAFALATFTAGVFAASIGLPLLHRTPVEPATSHMLNGTPAATSPANPSGAVAAQPTTTVHPGFTVRTPDGRAAALNTVGTVATVRSRNEHGDTQLASRQSDRIHAKLAKPARPKIGQSVPATDQPPVTSPDANPQTPPADQNSPQ